MENFSLVFLVIFLFPLIGKFCGIDTLLPELFEDLDCIRCLMDVLDEKKTIKRQTILKVLKQVNLIDSTGVFPLL